MALGASAPPVSAVSPKPTRARCTNQSRATDWAAGTPGTKTGMPTGSVCASRIGSLARLRSGPDVSARARAWGGSRPPAAAAPRAAAGMQAGGACAPSASSLAPAQLACQ